MQHMPEPGGFLPEGLDNAIREARGQDMAAKARRGLKTEWGTGLDGPAAPRTPPEHADNGSNSNVQESAAAQALRAFAKEKVHKSLESILRKARERIRGRAADSDAAVLMAGPGAVAAVTTAGCSTSYAATDGGDCGFLGCGSFLLLIVLAVALWLQRGKLYVLALRCKHAV